MPLPTSTTRGSCARGAGWRVVELHQPRRRGEPAPDGEQAAEPSGPQLRARPRPCTSSPASAARVPGLCGQPGGALDVGRGWPQVAGQHRGAGRAPPSADGGSSSREPTRTTSAPVWSPPASSPSQRGWSAPEASTTLDQRRDAQPARAGHRRCAPRRRGPWPRGRGRRRPSPGRRARLADAHQHDAAHGRPLPGGSGTGSPSRRRAGARGSRAAPRRREPTARAASRRRGVAVPGRSRPAATSTDDDGSPRSRGRRRVGRTLDADVSGLER